MWISINNTFSQFVAFLKGLLSCCFMTSSLCSGITECSSIIFLIFAAVFCTMWSFISVAWTDFYKIVVTQEVPLAVLFSEKLLTCIKQQACCNTKTVSLRTNKPINRCLGMWWTASHITVSKFRFFTNLLPVWFSKNTILHILHITNLPSGSF